ncbi:potassium channel family protein [Mycolicibacterium fluoranthenivorans]|uniref:Voltage-gated potassium channel n=1 Tax=Mycolicibacterium fluoranthenivorans TaxID=258505 RepID=A0A7X5U2S7_9MYCO|nr:potassium channel family protein [Mycolicibacterium fluoranthenivorans]MCV7354074.1 potassium channel family protein [Mycolicibacterium fluoranthenivorans]NIH97366.1 voltage-gated potassium channel [Mycolicibacterium fluoranthenivorans]
MSDQTRLERFEQRTEWLMAAVALIFLGCYSVQVLAEPHGFSDIAMRAAMAGLYLVFVADYLVRFYLADPRGRWFLRNLVDLAIVVLPMFRPLRLLSLAVVLEVLQRAVGHSIRGRVAAYTAGGVVMIVYAASLAVLDVERHAPHAQITSFGDAVWWAVSTVTTVGYGDLTPVTLSGRLIAVALMVAGISLLGVVTATLASWIVEKVAEEDTANQAATAAHIEELREEIRKLRDAMRSDAD